MSVVVGTDWCWCFNHTSNSLELLQSNFKTIDSQLSARQLIPDALSGDKFDLEDANSYQAFYEQAADYLDLPPAELEWLVCRATAAKRFFKPTMPKSWFFLPSSAHMTLDEAYVVEMDTASGVGQFLILEVGEKASLFMLFSEQLTLSEGSDMKRGELIKVMNDRVARYATSSATTLGYANLYA